MEDFFEGVRKNLKLFTHPTNTTYKIVVVGFIFTVIMTSINGYIIQSQVELATKKIMKKYEHKKLEEKNTQTWRMAIVNGTNERKLTKLNSKIEKTNQNRHFRRELRLLKTRIQALESSID
ncbi:MAG: hypothetical protein V3V02_11110 [Rhizobiaceae bacterium]